MEIKIDSIQDVKKLLDGKHESQNKIAVGYVGDNVEEKISRKIGDKWFDADGNEWEQKKGYKIKLGKEWQQELHEYLKFFQLLKSREKLYAQDQIWKKICEELNYKIIPSL